MKVLFRNFRVTLSRFKLASFLNILGLSVAFAAFIIIIIQVRSERTFDASYKNADRIFRVESTMIPSESSLANTEAYTAFSARPLIEMLISSIPQIEAFTILHGGPSEVYVNYETAQGERHGMMMPYYKVSEGMPAVFDMEMIEGESSSLSEPGKILLPESLARKMFGKHPAVDRQIFPQSGNTTFYTVGGVYKDFPSNSSMINDAKIGLADEYKSNWHDWTHLLFIVLTPDASPEEVEEQLKNRFEQTGIGQQMGLNKQISFRLNPINEIYYRHDTNIDIAPKGNRATTNLLFSIALLVIAIAAINYVNFSTALTPARIKSINTQKVLGCSTLALRLALLFEAVGICILSFLPALLWVFVFDISDLSGILLFPVDFAMNTDIIGYTFLLSFIIGAAAGIYPALYMTSFPPVLTLKGSFAMGHTGRKLRILLTGFQFVISTGLIIAALFIHLQNRYMYRMEGIMNSGRMATVKIEKDLLDKHADRLFEKLKANPVITDVTFSEWPVGFLDHFMYSYAKSAENEDIRYYYIPVSYNFTHVMQLTIMEGRGFEKADARAGEERLIFNELAARLFNIKPGDRLSNGSLVVGIVKDFNFMNLRKAIEPMALSAKQTQFQILEPTIYIQTTDHASESTEHIRKCIAEIDPLYPAEIQFYDRQFEEAYQKERKTSAQITLFCLLAVIISLVGVFGLTTFETQYRQKEIGIRKAMGSGTLEIISMFNRKFILTGIVCFFIAAPIAWLGVREWLTSFAYRTPLHGWIFALSLLIVLLITTGTVTLQSWRAASSNPVDVLKNE